MRELHTFYVNANTNNETVNSSWSSHFSGYLWYWLQTQ